MQRDPNPSDAQIVQQVLSGYPEAFGALVERHLSVVHGLAYVQVGNRADAEDVAQEAFLRAFRSLDTLRGTNKFLPWLAGITRNVCRGFKRVKAAEDSAVQKVEFGKAAVEPDPATEELYSAVRAQVRRLGRADQEVLVLHYFAGKTTREVADILCISRHAAKKRLERARVRLAAAMIDALGDALEPSTPAKDRCTRIMAAVALCEAPWQSTPSSPRATTAEPVTGIGGLLAGKATVLVLALLASAGFILWCLLGLRHADPGDVPNIADAPPANHGTPDNDAPPESDEEDHGLSPESVLPASVQPEATVAEEMGSVSGQVVMADTGQPVPGVEVITSRQFWTAVTDQSGRFHIERCLPGQHKITVRTATMGKWVPTGGPLSFSVSPNRQTSGVVIPVTAEGVLEGVLTMSGEPLAHQYVSVFYEERKASDPFGLHVDPSNKRLWRHNAPGGQQWKRTDATGRFRFGGLIDGVVKVRADLTYSETPGPSRSMLIQTAVVAAGATTSVHLEFLPAEGVIQGQLFLDEAAVKHAGVGAKPADLRDDDDGEIYFADVDANGRYVLDGLPSETLSVWAYVRGSDETDHAQRCAWVTTVPGQTVVCDFDFFRQPRIAGYVSNLQADEQATVVAVEGRLDLAGYAPQTADDLRRLNPRFEANVQADGTFYIHDPELAAHTVVVLAVMKQGPIEADDSTYTRWGTATAKPSRRGDSRVTVVLE